LLLQGLLEFVNQTAGDLARTAALQRAENDAAVTRLVRPKYGYRSPSKRMLHRRENGVVRPLPKVTAPSAARVAPDLAGNLEVCPEAAALFAEHDTRLTLLVIENHRFDALALGSLYMEECVLRRVALANSSIALARLRDVRFENCDLANLDVRALECSRVEFVNCRMTGFRAREAKCQDVLIAEGDQRYAQFRFSRFRSSEFASCNFEEADFQGADLSGCILRKCNLGNAELSGAKLKQADLRGCVVDGLKLNAEDLRGAIVDPAQALSFAHLLGIRIL
jgi:uncharacterized protein YjbI with pentapeptide repeats